MNKEPTPWSDKKEKLKEQYPSLTDEDLTHERGGVNQLLDNIQQKIGKSRDEVKKIIKKM